MKTFEDSIQLILDDIERRKTIDYGNKASVRQYNTAYDRIAKNMKHIETKYPNRKGDILEFMYHEDTNVAHTFSCLVIYGNIFSVEQKKEAVCILDRMLSDGSIHGVDSVTLGFVMPKWKQELGMV